MTSSSAPTFDYETRARARGYRLIAGVDEAGRGALAGPVVAAAVIAPEHGDPAGVWAEVRDSKLLSPPAREELFDQIRQEAIAYAIAPVAADEIDAMGIAPATRQAMTAAIRQLAPAPDFLLIDWVRLPLLPIAQESFSKADRLSVSVAAASILAKVYRDRLMVELDSAYPVYGFAANKGYGARIHLDAIDCHGPSPHHRYSFAPIARRPTLFDGDSS